MDIHNLILPRNYQSSNFIVNQHTNTGHLIHKKSLHSNHFKHSIIRSQILRMARKCTFKKDFDFFVSKLFYVLRTQGYTLKLLRNMKYEVLYLSGFYSTFNMSFGFYPCNSHDCDLCSRTLSSTYAFDNNFKQFRILYFINCKCPNVIFSIHCNICGPISVNFSCKPLYKTFNSVIRTIMNNPLHPLSVHFHKVNHSLDNLYIQGLDLVFNNNFYSKLINWINKLETFMPPGIDTFILKPYSPRLVLRFTHSNFTYFKHIQNKVFKRFGVKISSAFSSHPNLKQITCKSKFICNQ